MEDCNRDLDPDALTFDHGGKDAGGICSNCLDDAPAIRVVFAKNEDGVLVPKEIAHLDKPI